MSKVVVSSPPLSLPNIALLLPFRPRNHSYSPQIPHLSISTISPFLPSHFYLLFSLFLSFSLYLSIKHRLLLSANLCFREISISDVPLSLRSDSRRSLSQIEVLHCCDFLSSQLIQSLGLKNYGIFNRRISGDTQSCCNSDCVNLPFARFSALGRHWELIVDLEMSRTTNESEDGLLSKYHSDSPLIDESNGGSSGGVVLKKGPWTSVEDALLVEYVKKHGEGNWNAVQKHSGLSRCGKSCRLRWANHLRPNLKKGAFTADEERLIIELHAKMGNKWARMAAHLPGRTDNEIKNYWNTRIKRRQRAGLPLYPPDLCLQAYQENQQGQNTGGINCGDRGQHDPLQANTYEIPNVVFDGLKGNNEVLSYVSDLPDISMSSMLLKGIASPQYYSFVPPTIHRQKRLRESSDVFPDSTGCVQNGFPLFDQFQNDTCDKVASSFGTPFPSDIDPNKSLLSFDVTQGGQSLSNGNSSASKPTYGAVKLELPSLQYTETDLGTWRTSPPPPLLESVDAFIQSPPIGAFESDCSSPRNSGLLDALIHESNNISSGKKHSSEKSTNSSSISPGDMADNGTLNVCENEWEDYGEPISPFGHSVTSFFNGCISASGSSLDEPPSAETITGSIVKAEPVDADLVPDKEKESKMLMDFTRPDALLGSDWFEQSSGCMKDHGGIMTDAIATLIGDKDLKHMPSSSSPLSQEWGFSYCAWNNMPAVCQMSDLP